MASRNIKTTAFDSVEKVPSSTLKRHPKMELNKNDLLKLLSYLEGELQARDITIAALKAEKAKQLLYQAKYGRFGLGDPFHALQRDSDCQKDNSFDEAAIKAMYDNQLTQLENLIETQRKAQLRMREQLVSVEKRYHKVCAELEDEKRKHAQDTAQGDDVTYMLEKERERLKNEVDFEKSQTKKLEKELKKATTSLEEEQATSAKHKQVAIMLIKERKKLAEKLFELQGKNADYEQILQGDKSKVQNTVQGNTQENQKSLQVEAIIEKQLMEFDIEREQLKNKLAREENRNKDLQVDIDKLQKQIDILQKQLGPEKRGEGPKSIEIKSSQRGVKDNVGVGYSMGDSRATAQTGTIKANPGTKVVFKNTPPNTPPEVRKVPVMNVHESPERDLSLKPGRVPSDSSVKRAIMAFDNSPTKNTDRTLSEKQATHEKLPADVTTSRINVHGSGGATMFTAPSSGTTVFTTPSGTRISLNVGPQAGGNMARKPSPAGRGVPPPVPPNKPQFVPQSTPRKDARPSSAGRVDVQPSIASKPPVSKFGITISKDKITISSPDDPNENTQSINAVRPMISTGQPNANSLSGGSNTRKPSQVCVNHYK